MAFPKIRNKHTFSPMFSVGFLMRGKGAETRLPKKAILIYANNVEELFVRELGLERMAELEASIINYSVLTVYKSKIHPDLLVLKVAVGAPVTAMVSEDIIRLGVEELLIMGEAGGIKQDTSPGEIVLCDKAVRDEGTSHHYLKASRYAKADATLTKRMGKLIKKAKIKFIKGPTWSIDAPYTESKEEVEKYSKMGVVAVEMEAAALFAVALKRGAKASAVLIISDVLRLDSGWSGFDKGDGYMNGLKNLTSIAKLFAEN